MHFRSTSVTTQGGPRQISLFAGSTSIYSHVIDLTGVPTDRQIDAKSPYHLTYNPTTGKATISGIPAGSSFVELYYRKKGAPEQDNFIVGSKVLNGQPSSITLSAAGMPSSTGYLEAEFLGNKNYDTNELQISSTLVIGDRAGSDRMACERKTLYRYVDRTPKCLRQISSPPGMVSGR